MGLLYTMFYLDFEPEEWKQITNDPASFEAICDDVSIEIDDTSQNNYKLKFKKGGKIHVFRVVGKFRITWDDDDLVK